MPVTSLKGKVIAITGGAGGIGYALAKILADQGAILSLADVLQTPLEEAGAALAKLGAKVMVTVVDVRDTAQVDKWIEDTVKAFGRLDGAANLAGVLRNGTVKDCSDEEWGFVMDINVNGVLRCVRAEIKAMEKTGGGSIVNAGSLASHRGALNFAAYVTSKHAVVGITRCAARESGKDGIRVNAICPGLVNTTMVTDQEKRLGRAIPDVNTLARRAEPEEVARLVVFLLSDDSSHMTGAMVNIDGGNGI